MVNDETSMHDYPVKLTRPTFRKYMMAVCRAVATRATCRHRNQGAIIVKDKRILATGYNGAPPGVKDCLERGFCFKAEGGVCLAEGLHGESNAIISAAKAGIAIEGADLYCVYSPCISCCNMLKVAGIHSVYYSEVYSGFPDGPVYLETLGITVERIQEEDNGQS